MFAIEELQNQDYSLGMMINTSNPEKPFINFDNYEAAPLQDDFAMNEYEDEDEEEDEDELICYFNGQKTNNLYT